MMRILTSFVTGAALLMTAGLIGCAPDPDDVFDTLLTTVSTVGDGDGDTTGDGDGDADTTGPGDGDGEPGDGDGDACELGMIGDPCDDMCGCADGLTCDGGTCSLGGGDGDGDGDGDVGGCTSYDPAMCEPPGQPIGVGGIEGGFCSCACTTDADCLAGPPGTVGACALQTMDMMTFCALICSVAMDACPEGSTCKTAGQMDPDVGLCTYP